MFTDLRAAVPDHHLFPFLGVALDRDAPRIRFREFRGNPDALAAVGGISGAEHDARALARFVADAPRHRKHERIVLDFRGHGGGSGAYAIDWAQQLRSTTTQLRSPITAVHGGTTRQQLINTWNAAMYSGKHMLSHPFADQMREQAKLVRAAWPPSRQQDTPAPTPAPAEGPGTGPSDWNGEVIVLVDRRSGSAGEFAPLMLKEYLGATVVGERTAGYAESGNMQKYQLPATGLYVGVPSGHNVWRDPAVKEGAGIPVDVALERPGMPAEAITAALDRARNAGRT